MPWIAIGFLMILLSIPASATEENADIADLFSEQGIDGTIVIESITEGKTIIYNYPRSLLRFPPASSFKIFNTLIALEEKAVNGQHDVFKWNGQHYDFQDWNHDQTLQSAFKVSCVWCYQQIATAIGAAKYRQYLTESNYGVLSQNFDLTHFWLDGSLLINAQEQVTFLKKAYLHQLPFSERSYRIWREVTLAEQTDQYKLYAKTGWANRMQPQIGWYIGYIETPENSWVFATNISLRTDSDLALRQQLTKAALTAVGIIPAP